MGRNKEVVLNDAVKPKLGEWFELRTQKAVSDAREFELRQAIVREAGFTVAKLAGTETIDIGGGWRLQAVKVQNMTMTNEQGQTANLLAKIAERRHELAVGLVKWKPELSTKTYKELIEWLESLDGPDADYANEVGALLAAALTIKPGAPQLEVLEPEKPIVIETVP